jgi:8-amino-7-oxononanoate synthase
MRALEERLARELERFRSQSQYRSLTITQGVDFTSNDYLGLANSEFIRERAIEVLRNGIPLSASGSRLLRGNHALHEELEERFSKFLGAETTLLFNSGYDANFSLLTTLPTRHDTIVIDELVHASVHEGVRASLAEKRTFKHNSVESLASVPVEKGDVYVVVDALYSMDGDEAPLRDITALCVEQGWTLIVDEAHSTGVFGDRGEGLVNEMALRGKPIISMHTFGKSLASQGAVVACSRTIKEYLINRSRPLIFSTALPPLMAAQVIAALDLLESDNSIVKSVACNANFVRSELKGLTRWKIIDGRSPIVAVVIGDNPEALKAAQYMQNRSFDVRAIRPPSVPKGTSRLRVSIHADHTREQLEALCDAIKEAEAACAA